MIEILSFCLLCLIIIYCYNLILFIKFAKYKPSKSNYSVPVSIIICAKNEEDNLKLNLRHVLHQEYKDFEVIVVNDQSIDGSKYYLESLQKKFDNLVVCNLDEKINTRKGKKFALTIGIKLAKHENLLLIVLVALHLKNQLKLRVLIINKQLRFSMNVFFLIENLRIVT